MTVADKKPVNPIAIRAQANTPWNLKEQQKKTNGYKTNKPQRQNSNNKT